MAGSILIDGRQTPINVSPKMSLAVVVSIVDRALFKRGLRIGSVKSDDTDLFCPDGFNIPWSTFEQISCKSEKIPATLKRAVVTLTIGDKRGHQEMRNISHPIMKAYADKVGADFVVIDEIKLRMKSLLLEKWQMFDLLFKYGRILFLDTDILVAPNCPDMFEMVPSDKVAALVESDHIDCNQWITDIQGQLGDIGWRNQYLNSGVCVYSYIHKAIFDRTQPFVVPGDQHTFNYRIKQNGFKVFPLPITFNHMELYKNDRFLSHVIHYAGSGFTDLPCNEEDAERLFQAKIDLMRKDAGILYN